MIAALDHIVLVARDIEAGIAAYRTLLGRDVAWRAEADGAASASSRPPMSASNSSRPPAAARRASA